MPSTDTGDLAETSMLLTVKTADTEFLDQTGHALTAGNTDCVNALAPIEDLTDVHFLLEFALGSDDLLGNSAFVDLDLEVDVSLELAESKLADLSGADDTVDSGVS